MAEEKKEKANKKEAPAGWNLDPIEIGIIFLFLSAAVGTIGPAILSYLSSGEITFYGIKLSSVGNFFKSNVWFFKIMGFFLAGLAAFGTIVFNRKANLVWAEEKAKLYPPNIPEPRSGEPSSPSPLLLKWQKIVEYSQSENPSDWRLAIIEADIMLDDLLYILKVPGETIGDKLKAIEPSDFLTLNQAWEAHKARNKIAHEGSGFLLNKHEVARITSLYEAVFKEFHLI